jgi:putative ABC transport system permease protein
MFKNFFKVTVRSLMKSKLFVFVNILGLGLALACCIVAYLNYNFAMSFDSQHQNADEIYMISSTRQQQGNQIKYGLAPMALGSILETEIPNLKAFSRFEARGVAIKKNDKTFNRRVGFVDEAFLEMFNFPLLYGDKENLKDISNVFLSEATATTLFGEENALGKTVEFINPSGANLMFTVGGVLKDVGDANSIQFSALSSFENYFRIFEIERNDWEQFVDGVFVQTTDASSVQNIPELLSKYVPIQNEARKDFEISGFWTVPMEGLAFMQRDYNGTSLGGEAMHPAAISAPNIMAILILLLACFNFTNTAIAMSNKRLKEIGIRKTVGGSRGQLIFQFLGENILLCAMALVVGIAMAMWLVPKYSDMWPGMTLVLNLAENRELVFFLVAVLLGTAFIAGGYPALYVSKFKPVSILRGTLKVGRSSILSKILLTLQFTISVLSLVSGFAFLQNANYQSTLDQGYDKDELLVVPLNDASEVKTFVNAISDNPSIQSIATTNGHIGYSWFTRPVKNKDSEIELKIMDVGLGYDETVGFEILEGRGFNVENQEVDNLSNVVVNEKMVAAFGWTDAIGQQVTLFDTLQYRVVGVIKDYYDNLFSPIQPMMMRLRNEDQVSTVVVRADVAQHAAIEDYLETEWAGLFPERPYNGFIHEQNVNGAQDVNGNITTIFLFLSFMAVVLSAIGLFTLVSINILSRTKEIGVRKVLGASNTVLATIINKPFLIVIIIASLIGASASMFVTTGLMSSIFAHHVDMGILSYLAPILFILFISFLSITGKVLKATKKNPVESLRYE